MNIEQLLKDILKLDWRLWVYCEPYTELTLELNCLVINVDDCDLGNDGFTPLVIENNGFCELISIQDLQGVIKKSYTNEGDLHRYLDALQYFINNDSYISDQK